MTASAIHRRRTPLGPRRLASAAVMVAAVSTLVSGTVAALISIAATHNALMADYRGEFLAAGHAILSGHSPYHEGLIAHFAALKRAGIQANVAFVIAIKPAPVLIVMSVFSVLPTAVGGAVFALLSIGAVVLALRWLGVNDWRCHAIAVVSWPTLYSLYLGNASVFLLLGAAAMWRWRERLWPPAIAFASLVILKLFPWPLGLFALIRRRPRQLAAAALVGGATCLLAWAVIGFDGLGGYPRMLSNLELWFRGSGPSLESFLLGAGLPVALARYASLAIAAGLAWFAWRRGRTEAGERSAFGLLVMVALIAAPHIWEHYLVLLFVPVALLAPRLSPLWLVPAATALIPTPDPHQPAQMLLWVAVQGVVVAMLCRPVAPQPSGYRARIASASAR